MGRGRNKNTLVDSPSVKQVLGRIFRMRHEEEGAENALPFLLVKERTVRVDLQQVVNVVIQYPEQSDQDIVGLIGVPGLRPADIEIVRSYIHRFGGDIANPLPIEAHKSPILLLDENAPQPAMLSLSQCFGWATHVAAEGLAGRDTPDEDIWEFASRYNFAAYVTRDTDFFYIQKQRAEEAETSGDHVPLLVFVSETLSTESLSALFVNYALDIRYHLRARSIACQLSTEDGCHALHL